MLYYNKFTVNVLLLLQVLAVGVCGTHFNFCIVCFVCLGYYFRDSISRGRRVYDNVHTTYVLFIIMCCGVSFALQSIALSSASRNLALAKSPTRDAGNCNLTTFESIDELASRYKRRGGAASGACGPGAYDRVALEDRYPLAARGDAAILFGDDAPRWYTRACNDTQLRCFLWCVRLESTGACFRPAWSMVYNVYTTNARVLHLVVDRGKPHMHVWPQYTHELTGGARIHTRNRHERGLPSFATHIEGVREIDRMPEPYTDEFLVVEPLNALMPTSVEIRLRARCVPGSRVCVTGIPPSPSVSVSASLLRLSQGAAIAPYTIMPVAGQCRQGAHTHTYCELPLGALLTAHVLNTLVLVSSIYVALLTHALDTPTHPVRIVLATTCVFTLNWVGLLSLGATKTTVSARGIWRILLGALQIAQLSVFVYELNTVDFAHNGLLEAYAREDTRWTFWVLAPAMLLHGHVYLTCIVLGAAATTLLFCDSLRLVRLYEHV